MTETVYTTAAVVDVLGKPLSRVKYATQALRLEPVAVHRNSFLWSQRQVERIGTFIEENDRLMDKGRSVHARNKHKEMA